MFVGDAFFHDVVQVLRQALRALRLQSTRKHKNSRKKVDEYRRLRKAFDRADRGGRGRLTRRAFKDELRALGFSKSLLSDAMLERLVTRFDTDGDDRIDYAEFMEFIHDDVDAIERGAEVVSRVRPALRALARSHEEGDEKGRRGERGSRNKKRKKKNKGVESLFMQFDTDGNGALSVSEFRYRFIAFILILFFIHILSF